MALGTPWHLARLGTWHALALGTCVLALVRVFARSWRASPGSVAGACVIRFVVVAADRPGALALGTPWHLARLGTWHVFVVIVLPWIMPARLVFSSCVLAARARRACPSAPVCQTRLSLGLAALAPGSTWHLARVWSSSCTEVLQAHMHCRHTCIAAHTGQMHVVLWTCTHSCKSGDGMDTTLKWMLARARGQGGCPLHPVLHLSYKSLFKGVKQSTNPSIFPYCLALRRAVRRMDRDD